MNNLTFLIVVGGAFMSGRWSKGNSTEIKLKALSEGIDEGYNRALVELYLMGVISQEDLVSYSK